MRKLLIPIALLLLPTPAFAEPGTQPVIPADFRLPARTASAAPPQERSRLGEVREWPSSPRSLFVIEDGRDSAEFGIFGGDYSALTRRDRSIDVSAGGTRRLPSFFRWRRRF